MKVKMFSQRKLTQPLFVIVLIVSLLLPSSSGSAKTSHELNLEAVDSFLQEQVKANRIPGVAVAIVQDDQIIFARGYGKASAREPVTPQTQFYIGSVSKGFTALAVMQLVEQGKMELDAPVKKYLPWFQVADPGASSKITVRHLLNHTSGLNEAVDPNGGAYTTSLEEQARLLAQVKPTAPAGSQFAYYNQNYRLLGLLIEQASGETYSDYIRDHVFEPLGMLDSVADPTDAPDLAGGYSRLFGFSLPRSQRFIPGALPSGYLISTAEDMARYLIAQLNNRQSNGEQMLGPESLALMRTPPAGINSEYGMGWMVLENGNMLAHGGVLEYFQAFVFLELKEKTGLVILFNQSGPENMLLENNAIRDGLLALLKGQSPSKISFGWIGWLLLAVFTADLLNHVRLFAGLPRWKQKTAAQNRKWLRSKVIAGILLPLFVILGLPLSAAVVQGVSPDWLEPIRLVPDLTIWLLLGMSLLLVRSLLYAFALLRQPSR
jgi:CubicO group peptidase (beta-lactamase class C family)